MHAIQLPKKKVTKVEIHKNSQFTKIHNSQKKKIKQSIAEFERAKFLRRSTWSLVWKLEKRACLS